MKRLNITVRLNLHVTTQMVIYTCIYNFKRSPETQTKSSSTAVYCFANTVLSMDKLRTKQLISV